MGKFPEERVWAKFPEVSVRREVPGRKLSVQIKFDRDTSPYTPSATSPGFLLKVMFLGGSGPHRIFQWESRSVRGEMSKGVSKHHKSPMKRYLLI